MKESNDYSDIANSWVATGDQVTLDDVLDYEKQLHEFGVEKREKREAKQELSATEAAHQLKQEWLRFVYDEIEGIKQVERDKAKGVTKKEFFEQWEKVDSWKMADLAISLMIDATQREWSKRHTEEAIGMAFGTLVFQATMDYNAKSRRKLERLDAKVAKLEGYDGPGRMERILQFADSFGFQSEKWQKDKPYQSKHGAPLMECVLAALPDVFLKKKEKRDKDTHLRWYIVLSENSKLSIEARNNAINQYTSYLGPMIMPPRKWSKDNMTPYARNEMWLLTPLVRHMGEEQKMAIEDAKRDGSLNQVLTALNAIQETPYEINRYVQDAVTWVTSQMDVVSGENPTGRMIGGFPNTKHIKSKPEERLEPSEFKKLPKKEQVILARKQADKARHNLSAKQARESFPRVLDQAAKAQKFLRFWLPHNLDYRGRVYHIPDFGHHNIDWIRALFMFSNKTLVTPENEKYLKRQIANTAGQDKKTLKQREQWVDDNEERIIAAGRDFKGTFEWWGSRSDESFQFLAACRDWAMYKEAQDFGEPYKSGLPCASDATQSGVQHYAAAGLSREVGEKVNLRKSAVPCDFYKLCLEGAVEMIRSDLSRKVEANKTDPLTDEDNGKIEDFELEILDLSRTEYPHLDDHKQDEQRAKDIARVTKAFAKTKTHAKMTVLKDIEAATVALELYEKGEYNRSHIKRNAMVFCYSSEEYGMAQQLDTDWMNKLSADVFDGKIDKHPFGDDDGFYAARYLAKIHYAAISREVSAAAVGMRFFQGCARVLAEDETPVEETGDTSKKKKKQKGIGKHVKFTNRLHFPMIQDYRDSETHRHKVLGRDKDTGEWDADVRSYYKRYKQTLNTDRTCNGIAPNVIHQQDSLHLMLTVLESLRSGVTNFMMIHDSFATTVAEAARLHEATKVAFVALYQDYNLYEHFLEQCKARHSAPETVDWPEPPKQGDLDVTDVFDSDYFFS